MQYTSVLVLLLAPLPLALCGFPSRFDCGYALLKKDHKPNTPPCSNSAYMENLGGMDADDCDKLGGHYFYCDNLNRAYPIHCIVSLLISLFSLHTFFLLNTNSSLF